MFIHFKCTCSPSNIAMYHQMCWDNFQFLYFSLSLYNDCMAQVKSERHYQGAEFLLLGNKSHDSWVGRSHLQSFCHLHTLKRKYPILMRQEPQIRGIASALGKQKNEKEEMLYDPGTLELSWEQSAVHAVILTNHILFGNNSLFTT